MRLLQDGDIESNPGPQEGPCSLNRQAAEEWLRQELYSSSIFDQWSWAGGADPGTPGPSSANTSSSEEAAWPGLAAARKRCDAVIRFNTLQRLLTHRCHLPTNVLTPIADLETDRDDFLEQLLLEHADDQC